MTKQGNLTSVLPDLDVRIGIVIEQLRKHHNMTQWQLAKKAGVSQACISYVENAKRGKQVKLIKLQNISLVLGQNRLSDLIRFAEDIPKPKGLLEDMNRLLKKHQKKSAK